METSVNNGMCRCCASEGAFKDVKTTYHWMGEEEIYSDMLRDCFDINLEVSEQGQDGGICEVCITQLRNAINFKKQVLHTEEQFKIHLQNKTMFRPNIVKVELQAGEESDDLGSGDDAFSGPEFEVPIKMETEETKPKKRGAKASATTTRAKKAKTDNGETSNKRRNDATNHASQILKGIKEELTPKIVTNTKLQTARNNKRRLPEPVNEYTKMKRLREEELRKHRHNIKEILLCSNATPIRKYAIGYVCCFCTKNYPEAADLKEHTIKEHDENTKSEFMKKERMQHFVVKLDITDLKCTLCEKGLLTVEDLITHLENEHDKTMFTDIKSHIIPFKFEDAKLKCSFCPHTFDRFKVLQEHMYTHYDNFVCNVCGTGFVNERMLYNHKLTHKVGLFKCCKCDEKFDTIQKKRYHEKVVHLLCLNKCGYCDAKFLWYPQKCAHMAEVHGVEINKPKECKACNKIFESKRKLELHIRRDHLLERRFKCTECEMEFFTKALLSNHMVKHSGVKMFPCKVCSKSYSLMKGLREHMRIHNNDKRFKCEICDQAFVQKCSWRGHMRSKHGTIV
ncbi:zinc finger protein 286A isoform X3 [Helicoverpa armigera]|uniref:zinc finger protein 286A isoform X3 n=1 Tax=Helicoverpa armigera TaxID=29058 RepID=UPI003082F913